MASNLQWLYENNEEFREACREAAKEWLGSTSGNFAGSWLEMQHETPAMARSLALEGDLPAQADEEDSREKLEADMRITIQAMVDDAYDMGMHEASWSVNPASLQRCVSEWLDRQAAITERDVRTYLNREDSELIQRKVDGLQARLDKARDDAEMWHRESDHWRLALGDVAEQLRRTLRFCENGGEQW